MIDVFLIVEEEQRFLLFAVGSAVLMENRNQFAAVILILTPDSQKVLDGFLAAAGKPEKIFVYFDLLIQIIQGICQAVTTACMILRIRLREEDMETTAGHHGSGRIFWFIRPGFWIRISVYGVFQR